MSALTDLLERHVPYASVHRTGMICLQCVDIHSDSRHGEYPTATEWAAHIEAEIQAAGLKISRLATANDTANVGLF